MARRLLVLVALAATSLSSGQVDPALFGGLKWREIGPFRGGRSCAVTGVKGRPNEFYGGFVGGGVFKSTDAGQEWQNVTDGFFKTSSVGAIAVSESDPDFVVVGMGETEIRGNISVGDGVYRSRDAGKTWMHLGLETTQSISRVRIHPKNKDIIWVAALGHVYGPHQDRGVYKTTDGGLNWKKTLYVDDRSGAVDLCLDPANPDILFAATWTAWRTPYGLNSGGPGSRLWKSTDGGDSWKDISANPGLPAGTLGKMGVSISGADSKRVYAMIEAAQGGLYRSDDGGDTWKLASANPNLRQRPWYYTRVYADPKNADKLTVLNVSYHTSTNGGSTFGNGSAQHSDHHDMWIDPDDPKRMIMGNDGGVAVSVDGGQSWSRQDMATAQFYHVSTDNAFPYRILGAQQDNSTVRIPSSVPGSGIGRSHWTGSAGGESGYVAAKPDDPEIVFGGNYSGSLDMVNHATGESRQVDPWPDNPMGGGVADILHRFQWTYPIIFSPHNPNRLYTCSQHVLVSEDLGSSWRAISPDLTRNEKEKQQSTGGPITKDNTGVEVYGTVFTLAESTVKKNLLWAGSDDGLIHVTTDGGRRWTNVTPAAMPQYGLVSIIEASPHEAKVAFAAVDNHENDDHSPYLYRTDDLGKTWTKITNGIPGNYYVRVIREDPTVKGLLYAGTEFGIFVSFNNGDRWQPLQINLPNTPVHDLAIKEGDLIAATHGRSFWVLDDLSPLRQAAGKDSATPILYAPRPYVKAAGAPRRPPQGRPDETEPLGENPPRGMLVPYYLPADAKEITFEVLDAKGVVVGKTDGSKSKGMKWVSVSMSYPGWRGFTGMRLWGANPRSLDAPAGTYTVRMTVDGNSQSVPYEVKVDPRQKATVADQQERLRFSQEICAKLTQSTDAILDIRRLRSDFEKSTEKDTGGEVKAIAKPFFDAILMVEEAIYQTKAQAGQDLLNYPIRLNNKLGILLETVLGNYGRPPKQTYEVYKFLSKQLDDQLNALTKAKKDLMPKVNEALKAKGWSEIGGA